MLQDDLRQENKKLREALKEAECALWYVKDEFDVDITLVSEAIATIIAVNGESDDG
jgi:hypothetical protein